MQVPVPDAERPPNRLTAADSAAEDSGGLPRAGLDVIPLTALGLAMAIAGLALLRLAARRPD